MTFCGSSLGRLLNLTRHRMPPTTTTKSDSAPSPTVLRLGSPLLRSSASVLGLGDLQGSLWMWCP